MKEKRERGEKGQKIEKIKGFLLHDMKAEQTKYRQLAPDLAFTNLKISLALHNTV